jgi:hypothetical protein
MLWVDKQRPNQLDKLDYHEVALTKKISLSYHAASVLFVLPGVLVFLISRDFGDNGDIPAHRT